MLSHDPGPDILSRETSIHKDDRRQSNLCMSKTDLRRRISNQRFDFIFDFVSLGRDLKVFFCCRWASSGYPLLYQQHAFSMAIGTPNRAGKTQSKQLERKQSSNAESSLWALAWRRGCAPSWDKGVGRGIVLNHTSLRDLALRLTS